MRPVVLMILDGWGIGKEEPTNAVYVANAPFLKNCFKTYPHCKLSASGEDVGLPAGQMGNSEVGHLNIGAGRIVYQDLTRISKDIRERGFFSNKVLLKAFETAKKHKSKVHLMGLLSDGGVHSHIEHLKALLLMGKENGVNDIIIHAFMDGRDTPPDSGIRYIKEIKAFTEEMGVGKFGIVSGRYYAMDRDKRWERVKLAYDAMTRGEAEFAFDDPVNAVAEAYRRGETDEFIKPTIIKGDYNNLIRNKDVVIFFNFRADRAREMTRALTEKEFSFFERQVFPEISYYVTMTLYDETLKNVHVAYPPVPLKNILGEIIAEKNIPQLRIAETEKYAHVTYFFNGGEEKPFPKEDRCLIPSPKDVPTYDYKPQMSAYEVTEELLKRLATGEYGFIVVNYANMDMVGHTGILKAAISAVEAVNICAEKVVNKVLELDGVVFLTADHGNAEQMAEEDGSPHTAHTTNKVPFIFISKRSSLRLCDGILADIAPTILSYLGIKKPVEMTGESLFISS
ncbi:MAG: 2,3-bisphosphoglycerate-independent phosphoglycerate mutase [bacterium]